MMYKLKIDLKTELQVSSSTLIYVTSYTVTPALNVQTPWDLLVKTIKGSRGLQDFHLGYKIKN